MTSVQHNIAGTVAKVKTLLRQINSLLVTQHQLVASLIAGCKLQLDVMEVLLRQNATDCKIQYGWQRKLALLSRCMNTAWEKFTYHNSTASLAQALKE